MKKYIILAICSFLCFAFLGYFYFRSESYLTTHHETILKLFLMARHKEASLEKEILKSKNYLSVTYDSLVTRVQDVMAVCTKLREIDQANFTRDSEINDAIVNYCMEIEQKLESVEDFKSQNAVFRNSLFYLQQLAAESTPNENHHDYNHRAHVIKATLAYALLSDESSKSALISVLRHVSSTKNRSNPDLSNVILHAEKILGTKEDLDNLTFKILRSESSEILDQLKDKYFNRYAKEEAKAAKFRIHLSGLCAALIVLIVFAIVRLIKAANELTNANLTLESRVEERTRELQISQNTILQQQEILVSTAKMSALGEMAGGIAHEINTPLAVISMRVEQMQEYIKDGETQAIDLADGLEVVAKTTERIAKIISGLRFFAREGKRDEPQNTRVSSLLEETLSFCKERFRTHGVQLEVLNNPTDLHIECRSVEISQVLLNLLNNAFDAIQSLNEKWIHINVSELNEHIEIAITDSGAGIPKEIHEKIMQPFFTTKEIGKGTGLGLSLSKGIIEDHQGKLYVDASSPNTKFVIRIPKKLKLKGDRKIEEWMKILAA